MTDPLLLTAVRIATFDGPRALSNASGFYFRRDQRLFVVTSRHVLRDEPSGHLPDRIEIELHDDTHNMASSTLYSIPLTQSGAPVWREGVDGGGPVDMAVIEIDRAAFPPTAALVAFTPEHLMSADAQVEVGAALAVVGFPLGFHDTLHHLPVVRQAVLSSAFGLRFQGQGYFLTDARLHRGASGAPVVMRIAEPTGAYRELPWMLLGVHGARFDVGTRDQVQDEALGLNCAWYAGMLLTLTQD